MQAFFGIGAEDQESFFQTFSSEILEAAFNVHLIPIVYLHLSLTLRQLLHAFAIFADGDGSSEEVVQRTTAGDVQGIERANPGTRT